MDGESGLRFSPPSFQRGQVMFGFFSISLTLSPFASAAADPINVGHTECQGEKYKFILSITFYIAAINLIAEIVWQKVTFIFPRSF